MAPPTLRKRERRRGASSIIVMNHNPYESTVTDSHDRDPQTEQHRRAAQRHFRVAALILLLPAAYNYVEFDRTYVLGQGLPADLVMLQRTVNLVAIVIGVGCIWQFGLPLVETFAAVARRQFARHVAPVHWNVPLYAAVRSLAYLAAAGAMLWTFWVFAIYRLEMDFWIASYTAGIPGHVLGACFYVPLLYRWYRLAKRADSSA